MGLVFNLTFFLFLQRSLNDLYNWNKINLLRKKHYKVSLKQITKNFDYFFKVLKAEINVLITI